MKINLIHFHFRDISKTIIFLILSDIFVQAAFMGFIAPLFAIYITRQIKEAELALVGAAQAVFLLTSSLFQIPIGFLIDKIKGERDDFALLFWGTLIRAFIPLGYLIIAKPLSLLLLQVFSGLTVALTFPSWLAIFTRHINPRQEGVEWATYNTTIQLMAAVSAALAGFLADRLGFWIVFVLAFFLGLLGTLSLLFFKDEIKKK